MFARTDYVFGHSVYHLEPTKLKKDGSLGEVGEFDAQHIEFIKKTSINTVIARPKIDLGSRVKDKLTDAEGIVGAITTYIYGNAPLVMIEPTKITSSGQPAKPMHFSEPRVIVLTK